jgi:hypothetical protein
MTEDKVFWVGKRPGMEGKGGGLAEDEAFVAAIREACEAAGCRFQRFVAAMGPYGTWVAEIQRDGEDQRVLWNGKEEKLVLQLKLPEGGWEDPVSLEVAKQTSDGFVERVGVLLDAAPDTNNKSK